MASLVTYPKFRAWVPSTGAPANSYVVRTFAAGSSTPLAVFTDAALTVPAANPFVLDANGEAIVYAAAGSLYKLQLYDPTNTTQQWSVDNITITGGGSGGGGGSSNEWPGSGLTPSFIDVTHFSVVGDQRTIFAVSRRLQSTNTGGTIYSTITASSFGGGITTVTVVNDSGVLDSGLSVVNVGIQNSPNFSAPATSYVNVNVAVGTSALTTGTNFTLNTANNFALTVTDTLGEFSASAGTFTAIRAGVYEFQCYVDLNTTGVTFSGTSDLFATITSGSGSASPICQFLPAVTGVARASATLSFAYRLAAGGTVIFRIITTFSAGTPALNSGAIYVTGPVL